MDKAGQGVTWLNVADVEPKDEYWMYYNDILKELKLTIATSDKKLERVIAYA